MQRVPADKPKKPTAKIIDFTKARPAPRYPATLKVLTVQAATLLEILRAKAY